MLYHGDMADVCHECEAVTNEERQSLETRQLRWTLGMAWDSVHQRCMAIGAGKKRKEREDDEETQGFSKVRRIWRDREAEIMARALVSIRKPMVDSLMNRPGGV